MKYYVYELCNPDGAPFYVGKGSGKRIDDHEKAARRGERSAKCDRIRAIWLSGEQIIKRVVFETDDEQAALSYEEQLVRYYGIGNLTNCAPGGRTTPPRTNCFRVDAQARIWGRGVNLTEIAVAADVDYAHLTRAVRYGRAVRAATAHRLARAFAQVIGVEKAAAFALLFEDEQ